MTGRSATGGSGCAAALSLAMLLDLAWPAWPQAPDPAGPRMSPAEFEARVTGKTFRYAQQGRLFGTEQYLPGRRVIWAFAEDTCMFGEWRPVQGAICFVYDALEGELCWDFFDDPDVRLRTRVVGDDPAYDLISTSESESPIDCPLPNLGS